MKQSLDFVLSVLAGYGIASLVMDIMKLIRGV
jgi:hypothetical protein